MNLKKIHFVSGLTITLFIGFHLFNHVWSIFGATKHIEMMNLFRLFYRNIFAETILIFAVIIQIISGLKLYKSYRKTAISNFEKLQIWTGLYLSFFLTIHLSAIFVGRYLLQLDTNFYFGVAGINTFPFSLFFVPYYSFAVISFFGHIACIHNIKMKQSIFNLNPTNQSKVIIVFGVLLTFIIFYGLTNRFKGVKIPSEYNILIGK